jgi:hypothetical protein
MRMPVVGLVCPSTPNTLADAAASRTRLSRLTLTGRYSDALKRFTEVAMVRLPQRRATQGQPASLYRVARSRITEEQLVQTPRGVSVLYLTGALRCFWELRSVRFKALRNI